MSNPPRPVSRRALLGAGGAGLAVAGLAGATGVAPRLLPSVVSSSPVGPSSSLVAATEASRRTSGRTITATLRAGQTELDLAGRIASTWAYNGSVPGPEIRASAGDRIRVRLDNVLPGPTTSVHWHGLALRNDMDGVPGVTQDAVTSGTSFDYDYIAPHPGTYWFHPHVGVQLDSGLYAPLVIEDPGEELDYDQDVALVLDDWTDGWGPTPDEVLANLAAQGMADMAAMEGDGGVSARRPLGEDTGDADYPAHLINGRVPQDPFVVEAGVRQRVRLRLINAAADTAYRFAVSDHQLMVTHTDGFPVQPVTADTVLLGMGERYDVIIETSRAGRYVISAIPEGKASPPAQAVLRAGVVTARAPDSARRSRKRRGRLLASADLIATESVRLPPSAADRIVNLTLGMGDGGRQWLLNGRTYAEHTPLVVESGERVRLQMRNDSMMFHPMHLHGHTFQIAPTTGGAGPRKDTVNVPPMTTVAVEFDTDNPGQWLVHCHNAYHGELGMMTVLSYQELAT